MMMSKKVDWKARCAEHCGTIGKRDATITELEAQLDTQKDEYEGLIDVAESNYKELEAEVYDATVLEHNLKSILKIKEAQLAVKTKLINNIKTCCSIRSVTAFLDRYEQALEQDND